MVHIPLSAEQQHNSIGSDFFNTSPPPDAEPSLAVFPPPHAMPDATQDAAPENPPDEPPQPVEPAAAEPVAESQPAEPVPDIPSDPPPAVLQGPPPSAPQSPPPKTREQMIQDQTLVVCEIGLEIEEVKATKDRCTKRLKHLLEDLQDEGQKLRDLREGKDVQQDLPLLDGPAGAASPPASPPAAGEQSPPEPQAPVVCPPAAAPPAPVNTDTVWRSTPIDDLNLADIKGFGKKKREALLEVAKTLGELEDLRAQAGAMGLQSVLPDGFGEKICGEIENKIIEWLSKNRDRAVLEQAAIPAAMIGDATAIISEILSEEDFKRRRAAELQELLKAGPLGIAINKEAAESGAAAAKNDDGLDACNWTAGEEQDSWLIGYLSVKSVDDLPTEDGEE